VIRRLLLGSGRFPAELRSALESEGILALDEGVAGSITYRRYRAPGRRYGWKRSALVVALAVTRERIVIHARGGLLADLPHADPRAAEVECGVDEAGRLRFASDASKFHPDRSGEVELRLRTARAQAVADAVRERVSRARRAAPQA
jgi:hypothetical protein